MSLEFAALLGFGAGAVCGAWVMGLLVLGRQRVYMPSDEPKEQDAGPANVQRSNQSASAPQIVQAPSVREDIA